MNESDLKKVLETLIKELEELKARIHSENRSENIILEEKHIPEKDRAIHRRIFLSSDSGQVKKIITHPICEVCGNLLSASFTICQTCGRRICSSCLVRYNGKIFCTNCLLEMIPLDKKDFKLLFLLTYQINRIREITELSGMTKEEVLNSLEKLIGYKFVLKRGFLFFSEIIPSEDGLSVLASYSKVYGNEEDVIKLISRTCAKKGVNRIA